MPARDCMNTASKNLRVAFVTPSRARGWRCQPVFQQFAKLFPNTVVFTGYWPGFTAGYEGTFEVRRLRGVRFFPASRCETASLSGFTWISPLALWDLLRFRPKVIFTNGFHLCALYALLVKLLLGSRVILLWQGISPETGGGRGSHRLRLRKLMARFMDLAICNTGDGVEYLQNLVGISPSRLWHETCEVADRKAFRSSAPTNDDIGAPSKRPAFLFVGRLVPEKGVSTLLQACGVLLQRGFNHFSVLLVGGGAHQEKLRELTRELGIENHVTWKGFVPYEELGACYQACDVFVLPSFEDTWGVTVLEAMLFGKPILCSRYAGAREMVQHGVNGFIFDARDPQELASHMARFISEPGLVRQFGSASEEMISTYTPERTAKIFGSAVTAVMNPDADDFAAELPASGPPESPDDRRINLNVAESHDFKLEA